MKGLQLVFQDIKAMWKHKHGRIALIFLLVVPLIYSGFFLAGYWNPYGKLDQLPVAVVNLDKGSEMDDKPVEAGDDFVEQLKSRKNWIFTLSRQRRQIRVLRKVPIIWLSRFRKIFRKMSRL